MDSSRSYYEALCHAYFDGRMTLAEEKAFFNEMQQIPELYQCFEGYLAVHKALKAEAPTEPSPLLGTRILAAIREEAAAPSKPIPIQRPRWQSPVAAAVLGVAVISSLILGSGSVPAFAPPLTSENSTLAEEAALAGSPEDAVSGEVQPAAYYPEEQFANTFQEAWHEVGTTPQDMSYLSEETEWLDPHME
jgi:hypothetical protein